MAAVKNPSSQTLRKRFSALRNLPPFFRLVWNTDKGLTVGNIGFRLLKAGIPVAMLYVGKEIIDELIRLVGQGGSARYLWAMVAVELGLTILSDLLSKLIGLCDGLLGDLVANRISVDLIRHAAQLDLYQLENPAFHDQLERARAQASGRNTLLSQVLAQAQDATSVALLGVGLAAVSPWLILILVVAVLPALAGEAYFNQRSYALTRAWTPQRRELDYLRQLGAGADTAKEIKVFGLAGYLAQRFRALADRYYAASKKIVVSRAIWGYLLALPGTLAYFGAFVYILSQTLALVITVGTMTFVLGAFQRLNATMQSIMSRFASISGSALYLQDLFDFFALTPTVSDAAGSLAVPRPVQTGFTFENVGFRYPGSDRWVVRHLDFTLRAHEKLALVGENGAGKTTLVKLLARLHEPTEGRILLDGQPLAAYRLTELRASIGVIFQDYVRYEMTVAENIAVGDIARRPDDARIADAARKSLADAVIAQFPARFQQMLGRRFQNGQELSGGQWQKIALARAYLRDAQLVVLDEPTSALDARAEHEVFQRFSRLIEGRMAVLISHRFSTVRMADRILFLENGRLLELGSHEELLQMGGRYAALFRLQARGYV